MNSVQHTFITLTIIGMTCAFGCSNNQGQNGATAALPPQPYNAGCYGLGCAGVTSTATPVPTAVPVGPSGNVSDPAVPTPVPLNYGATGQLIITNQSAFNTYVGAALNDPSEIQINVNLTPTSDTPQVFLGSMDILYNDNQGGGELIPHDGHFINGTTSANGNNVSILTSENGTPTYRIFFEDRAGSIILLLQNSTGTGSDTGSTASGQVWFRNFNTQAPNPLFDTYYEQTSYCYYGYDPNCTFYNGYYYDIHPSNPNAFCWAGTGNGPTEGPYDCRNFSVPPSTGTTTYTLLGTVQNLNLNTALGL